MNDKKIRKRLTAILISLLLCISCTAGTVYAYGTVNVWQKTSVTVYFAENGNGFSQVNFRIYRVADMNMNGEFTLAGDFRSYPVSLEDMNSSKWRALSQTLDAYVQRDGLQPLKTGITGYYGAVTFSDLSVGLYLITGDSYTVGNTTYTPEPMLVSLPNLTSKNEWNYYVTVYCKYDKETVPDLVQRKVQKVWEDDGNRKKRPKSISVQLLENGNVTDTVTLSSENNWEYTWENLDGGSRWTVVEKDTPDGYTVSVSQEGTTFIMTNTYPDNPTSPPVPPKLPQTGMLWWPVPLLICGGLLLTTAGILVKRRSGDSDEK